MHSGPWGDDPPLVAERCLVEAAREVLSWDASTIEAWR
jgi:hypothetical protein